MGGADGSGSSIPDVFTDASHMRVFTLLSAGVGGEIPASLSLCKELEILDLGDNFLTGARCRGCASVMGSTMPCSTWGQDSCVMQVTDADDMRTAMAVCIGVQHVPHAAGCSDISLATYAMISMPLTAKMACAGTIPENIGASRFLRYLYLMNNNLTGMETCQSLLVPTSQSHFAALAAVCTPGLSHGVLAT